jgi:maleylpyruvate isomerase
LIVFRPADDIEWVADAHDRCAAVVAPLTDEDVRRPSLLPGWSVGHLLTHLARNADSHVRRTRAALRGEIVDQYSGGTAGRQSEIEAGAGRPAAAVVNDVLTSARAVEAAWRDLPGDAWLAVSRDAGGEQRRLFELPGRRWQEVEVHLVDLGAGVTADDWPDAFVMRWLARTREKLWHRLPLEAKTATFASPAAELAWLYGRLSVAGLPAAPAWG